jgi:hypothetical protein
VKQDVLLPLLLNAALESAIRMVQENREELKLIKPHQLLVYADDFNLMAQNIHITKKNTAQLHAGKVVGLEGSAEKTSIYSLTSCHQATWQIIIQSVSKRPDRFQLLMSLNIIYK